MLNQLCFTNQQTANVCLPQGYMTPNNGPNIGVINYCGVTDDCATAYACLQEQQAQGSMSCQYGGSKAAVGTSASTSADGPVSTPSNASAGSSQPNSASDNVGSPFTVAAIVAAVLTVADSALN